jgi:hypothetical protein
MVESELCKDLGTDKCPLNIDDRVDGLEGRVTDMDKSYQAFRVETAASQARTQALQEEAAKRDKERAEFEAQRAKQDAEERKALLRLIGRMAGVLVTVILILVGAKVLAPGIIP